MAQGKQKSRQTQAAKKSGLSDEIAQLQLSTAHSYKLYRAYLAQYKAFVKLRDEKLTELTLL